MKLIKIKLLTIGLFAFSYFNQLYTEGFAAGTLIKTPSGYTKIEHLCVGDSVICNHPDGYHAEEKIVCTAKKTINRHVSINIANQKIYVSISQQFYREAINTFVAAGSLQNGDSLNGNPILVEYINQPIEVYLLGIAQYHNFLITKNDICAHNFLPPLILAISASFGLGSAELASISFGLAGLGSFLGYKWHKNKEKHQLLIQPQFSGNGMMPEDPENEKKKKRDEARANHKPLTNQEARELAKNNGYREVKNHPCGKTHNKPIFTNGKDYISPDRTVHKGGVWKVFNRRGDRIATANIDFTTTIGT